MSGKRGEERSIDNIREVEKKTDNDKKRYSEYEGESVDGVSMQHTASQLITHNSI